MAFILARRKPLRATCGAAALTFMLGACNGPPSCDSSAVVSDFRDTLYSDLTTTIGDYARFVAGEKRPWGVNYGFPGGRRADYDRLLAHLQQITPYYRKNINMPHYELWAHHYALINRTVSTELKNIQELPRDPGKPHQAQCRAGIVIKLKGRPDGGTAFYAIYTAQWYSPKLRGGSVMSVRIREAGDGQTQGPNPILTGHSPTGFAVEKLAGVLAAAISPQ
jgi:hypothetical protein